jgi:glycosyltransferase involved in cell wall biosynthesis
MATYNGSRFIKQQLDSILQQLADKDEVVIYDDCSTDETCQILESYSDTRIRLTHNPVRLGHAQNFIKAISLATGDYIALSDQDDIWVEGRLSKMMGMLEPLPPASLVIGEFTAVDEGNKKCSSHLNQLPLGRPSRNNLVQLMRILAGRVKYFGCTFIFKRELTKYIVPMPPSVEAHDVWIAINACLYSSIAHCEENTLWHRLHERNLTPKRRRTLRMIAKSRVNYVYHLSSSYLRRMRGERGEGGR